MTRRAVIDIGSSAVKYAVYDLAERGPHLLEEGDSVATGLGRGLAVGGALDDHAMARTLEALAAFREAIGRHAGAAIRAIATEAVRRASNRDAFVARVRDVLGARARVEWITAETEARWAWESARVALGGSLDRTLVVDPGGSSNDFAWESEHALRSLSLPFGMNRMIEIASPDAHAGRLPEEERARLFTWLQEQYRNLGDHVGRVEALVGSSGALIAIGGVLAGVRAPDRRTRLEAAHGRTVAVAELDRLIDELADQTTAARRSRHPCLSATRAPLFVHGCLIYRALLGELGLGEVRVNGYGIKLGAAMEGEPETGSTPK